MNDYGISLGQLFFVGLLSVLLTTAAVLGLQALYYWQLDRMQAAETFEGPAARLEAALAPQRKRLASYAMVDEKKGIVALPIRRAMDLVVEELSRKGSTSAAGGTGSLSARVRPAQAGSTGGQAASGAQREGGKQ